MALTQQMELDKSESQHDSALLHLALNDVASTLTERLVKLLQSRLKKPGDHAMIDEVAKDVAQLLELSFQSKVLDATAETRERRIALLHLLTLAEVKNLGNEWPLRSSPPLAANDELKESLTTEEAAKFLGVSRTHLISLIKSQALPARLTSGGHRRIPKTAVFAYKQEMKQRQSKGLDAMMAGTSALGLYDEELEGIPRRSKLKA